MGTSTFMAVPVATMVSPAAWATLYPACSAASTGGDASRQSGSLTGTPLFASRHSGVFLREIAMMSQNINKLCLISYYGCLNWTRRSARRLQANKAAPCYYRCRDQIDSILLIILHLYLLIRVLKCFLTRKGLIQVTRGWRGGRKGHDGHGAGLAAKSGQDPLSSFIHIYTCFGGKIPSSLFR